MKKGLYLLPSLFTLGNMGAGVYSIILSISGRYPKAAFAILAGIVFDILDGRIARMTKTESKFGIELDSLADLTSFGIAPALLVYQVVLHHYGNLGGVIAFLFIMAAAVRLARFNSKVDNGIPSTFFTGLPVPGAAGILAAFVLSYNTFIQEITIRTIPMVTKNMPLMLRFMPIFMVILAYLMVSNIRYTSFKRLKFGKRKPIQYFIFIILSAALVWLYPENMILIIFIAYILSGLFDVFYRLNNWRRLKRSGDTNASNLRRSGDKK